MPRTWLILLTSHIIASWCAVAAYDLTVLLLPHKAPILLQDVFIAALSFLLSPILIPLGIWLSLDQIRGYDTTSIASIILLVTYPAAIYAAYRLLIRHFRRHLPENLCPTCSYNLTANTTGTCPECGTAIPPAPRPS